jgi:hypothetical protein
MNLLFLSVCLPFRSFVPYFFVIIEMRAGSWLYFKTIMRAGFSHFDSCLKLIEFQFETFNLDTNLNCIRRTTKICGELFFQ